MIAQESLITLGTTHINFVQVTEYKYVFTVAEIPLFLKRKLICNI